MYDLVPQWAVYNHLIAKNVIHISEAEAASDFAALMARVRAGAKVIIENGERPVAVLHAAEQVRRSISECIALAKAHEEETGKAPVLDPDFAEDVDHIISNRKPWNPPAWEYSSTQASLSRPNAEAIPFAKSWNK